LAYTTALLAYVAALRGDFEWARNHAAEALRRAQDAGYIAPTSHAQSTLGELSAAEGDMEAARVALEAAVECARAPNEVYLVGRPLLGLALVGADQGDFDRAREMLMESLALARRLGNPHRVAQNLEGVAVYAAQRGQSANASHFASAALALRTAIEAPLGPTEQRLLHQRLQAAGPVRDADTGRHWSVDQACALAVELLREPPPPDAQFAYRVRGHLSAREAQVAALVARGLSNREIARTLTIAERTATSHVEHVLDKLGFHSRAQIATWVTQQRGPRG
jgi:ATP/maltotriose-dependent transcriptional regulator MalT